MSGADTAIRLAEVGKCYVKLEEQAMLLRSIVPVWRPSRSALWALRDADLTVARGETVGIIGRNGAGKTTLLRLLAGVTRPSAGRVEVNGRIAPLISVGVGFHREMSGRENVYVNAMLLGLTRRQIEKRFDEIVAFAELEDFIDTPVKFYSSGMFMRLGFSVAVHVDPDVLLVDEVLAVGDVAFQLKCFERMREIQELGTTILLVSHSMDAIRLLCPRAVLMANGRIEFDGDAGEAIAEHHRLLSASRDVAGDGEQAPSGPVRVTDARLIGPQGPTFHVDPDELVTYRATLRFDEPVASPQFIFRVYTQLNTALYEIRTLVGEWRGFEAGDVAEVEIPFQPRFGGGSYRLVLIITDKEARDHLYEDAHGLLIYAAGRPGTHGFVDLQARINVDGESLDDFPSVLLDANMPTETADPPPL